MLFNSFVFLAFATLFFGLWPLAKKRNNLRWVYIVVASFIFYGWWDWRFLLLILASGLVDYSAGLGMAAYPQHKRAFLVASLLANIGSLAIFKYSGFVAENLEAILAYLGFHVELVAYLPEFVLILPVGISFYTFQSMSYTFDVYRGTLRPTRNVLHFFAYLSMFPQLVAGPIVRAKDLLPQLEEARSPSEAERWAGLKLILHGYFKKVVIADNLAYHINTAFNGPTMFNSSWFWWFIITAFAFQIYFDFSGYSNIARGLARWMGYEFPVNFDHPYTSTSLQEFWRRWHISLSTWFRDYVYIPLGGSRKGDVRSHLNMWITMVVSGLWHGAAWGFVIWGAIHALFLSVERLTKWPDRIKRLPGGHWLAAFLIILQVWVAWVFFRANSLDQALHIITILFSFSGPLSIGAPGERAIVFLGIGIARELYVFLQVNRDQWLPEKLHTPIDMFYLATIMVVCVYLRGPGNAFIYFQF